MSDNEIVDIAKSIMKEKEEVKKISEKWKRRGGRFLAGEAGAATARQALGDGLAVGIGSQIAGSRIYRKYKQNQDDGLSNRGLAIGTGAGLAGLGGAAYFARPLGELNGEPPLGAKPIASDAVDGGRRYTYGRTPRSTQNLSHRLYQGTSDFLNDHKFTNAASRFDRGFATTNPSITGRVNQNKALRRAVRFLLSRGK